MIFFYKKIPKTLSWKFLPDFWDFNFVGKLLIPEDPQIPEDPYFTHVKVITWIIIWTMSFTVYWLFACSFILFCLVSYILLKPLPRAQLMAPLCEGVFDYWIYHISKHWQNLKQFKVLLLCDLALYPMIAHVQDLCARTCTTGSHVSLTTCPTCASPTRKPSRSPRSSSARVYSAPRTQTSSSKLGEMSVIRVQVCQSLTPRQVRNSVELSLGFCRAAIASILVGFS